jgi:long-chain fatty acid transport protein
MTQRPQATLLALVSLAALALAATPALAGGFSSARFGAEHGNAAETNPESIYYNPAGFGLSKGTHVTLDGSFVLRSATFEREDNDAANTGEGTLDNFLISPMVGVTSDLGLDLPVKVGAGFYVPFGGQAVWDKVEEDPNHPGAVDGPQRWYTIDGTIRTSAVTLAVAGEIEPANLSLGLSGNLLLSTINTVRARNTDGSDTLQTPTGLIQEGRSIIDASSTDFSLGVGALWEPLDDQLWVGLSYQTQPNLGGLMAMEGTLTSVLGPAQPGEPTDIIITQSLPDVVRLGVRFRPIPDAELRLAADYTRWSTFTEQCLLNKVDDPEKVCTDRPNNEKADNPQIVQVLDRQWEDTFGARLSGSYWPIDDLEVIAGVGYDSNAIPDETLEPALYDMDKVTASLGAGYQFTPNVGLVLTGTNVFYSERDTSEAKTAEEFGPTDVRAQPSSAAVYNQNIFLLNANMRLSF